MSKSTGSILDKARSFIYNNARLLDRRRFEYHFEGGSKEAVIEALRAYQNADGGFGNALEPNLRCPHSQPVATETALMIMDEIECFDSVVLEGIGRYLQASVLPEGGLPFVTRSSRDYPHMPWWRTDKYDEPWINPTGRLIALLYKQQTLPELTKSEPFERCLSYVWTYLETAKPIQYHDAVQWIAFLEHTPDRERAERIRPTLDEWLSQSGAIEKDPYAAGYVHKVLDWAPLVGDYVGRFMTDEEVKRHLQVLMEQQQDDGGWPINFDAISEAGLQEWRGWVTVDRLRTLRSYGIEIDRV
ncbi:hypothetical protein PCURB6_43180 [Paenibacillus curdlanolyticus]|nr:hypothetical protein [Paenibacillus curdlanolyticus]GFN34058.1 hypothetical protein PCURB6_43180 [Paenibacillus curdlanolyticus]